MSIQKLKNRIKKIESEVCGFGGSIIPKEEQVLVAKSKTEDDANRIFEDLKDKLTTKYGEFPDEDVLCFWVRQFSTDQELSSNHRQY
jgi:hypothetical protein